jgi:hypothetical protein
VGTRVEALNGHLDVDKPSRRSHPLEAEILASAP